MEKRGQISAFIFLGLMLFIVVMASLHLRNVALGRAIMQDVGFQETVRQQARQESPRAGDLDRDGVVDVHDIYFVGRHFGERCPPELDIAQSCIIGIDDAATVFDNFGRVY